MCFVNILLEGKYYFVTKLIPFLLELGGYQEGIYVWLTLGVLYPQY